jgi:hypothetical protein
MGPSQAAGMFWMVCRHSWCVAEVAGKLGPLTQFTYSLYMASLGFLTVCQLALEAIIPTRQTHLCKVFIKPLLAFLLLMSFPKASNTAKLRDLWKILEVKILGSFQV